VPLFRLDPLTRYRVGRAVHEGVDAEFHT
jgi:hypothetical protein